MAKPHWDIVLGPQERLVGFFDVVRSMRQDAPEEKAAA